ncbi:MAG: FtsL-like putative cell division protein [Muribaculaceae bacterium]|nr:FtsL-like putative cell division protein [Muribaculaceae bacterium]
MEKENKSKKRKMFKSLNVFAERALHGELLTLDLFLKHWIRIFLFVAMIIIFISSKYECQTCMEDIKTLKRDLEIIETECVRVKGEYMSRVRESYMAHLVDSMRLNLKVQEQPPFKLTYEEQDQ